MVFKRTPEEVVALSPYFQGNLFTRESLSVEFDTTAEFMREVLPSCFELGRTPTIYADICRWQSACVGEFSTAILWAQCRHGEFEGLFDLFVLFDGDYTRASYLREIWGEAAKTGTVSLFEDGQHAHALGTRNGVDLIEIEADLGQDQGPTVAEGHWFFLKLFPASLGPGLEYDPVLFRGDYHEELAPYRDGTAKLILRASVHDRLEEIPVISVGKAVRSTAVAAYDVRARFVIDGGSEYVGYCYGRNWDDLREYPVPARWRNPDKRPGWAEKLAAARQP